MAQLLDLASKYQQALDMACTGATAEAADASGRAFFGALYSATSGREPVLMEAAALELIVLRTTLIASIIAYFQRIPWTEVTLRMLDQPDGTMLAALHLASSILRVLLQSYVEEGDSLKGGTAVAILRQVSS